MAITPYIWLLWQTKTGKVIIVCVAIYFVVGILFKAFGWWAILVILLIVAILFLGVYLAKRDFEKEHQRQMKELNDEFERLHRAEKILKSNKLD